MGILGVKLQNMKMHFNTGGTWRRVGQCKLIHIWSESNLVNFEIPEGLNIVSGSSWPLYCESRMELDLAKNVPFQKFQ